MLNKKPPKVEILDVEGFKVLYYKTKPSRLEAKIVFDKNHISQRLIFILMNISHSYGLACSAPIFKAGDTSMVFMIGTVLISNRLKKKYIKIMSECLMEIQEFSKSFLSQLDFSRLDITMFGGVDLNSFSPEHLAAVRDQHYEGSWDKFYKDLRQEQRYEEMEIIEKCREFERINNKDIGLVGYKLSYVLNMLDEELGKNFDVN